jgi:cytochrome P450
MFVQVRPLARLELGIVMEELLKRTRTIAVASNKQPVRAVYPPSSFSSLSLRIA